jgi:hypothetical protein
VPKQRRKWARDAGTLGGFVATSLVVALCAVVIRNWHAGLSGDLLLGAAAFGVLCRIPHTVPVWAALTLLVATAVALSLSNEELASRYADLAYYCLAVGCLWAIWDMVLERLRWRLPGTALHERVVGTAVYPYSIALLLGMSCLAVAALAAYVVGLAGALLAVLAVVGLLLRLSYTAALLSGVALAACTGLLAATGNQTPAVYTGLLAAGAFLTALLWACWQMLIAQDGLARRGGGPGRSADIVASHDLPAAGSDRNTING